jgi:S-DNA-T family DNA segregation ATPase FtsK/SpoIIIE
VAEPAPKPFTLESDNSPVLKPVSPEKAVTAPVPTAHDNTEPEAYSQDYGLPPIDLLGKIPPRKSDAEDIQSAIAAIENVFEQFRIGAKVVNYKRGPVLTQFEIRPEPHVDLKKFEGTRRNLLMNLRAESIRIQAPIPGRDLVGIEVPNSVRQSVTLREILEGDAWREAERKMELPLALGKLATGGDLIVDLAEMPHLLVAGGTGSGKSVAVNDMLVGLLMCRKPDRLRLLMVDPKRVEFTSYDNLPHLLNPVVVEPKKVMFTLRWAKMEMERRYEQLQRYSVRNIGEYNQRVENPLPHRDNPTVRLPFIVLIIDELADLMNDPSVRAEIEMPIAALTAKARAAGIHLIIATQRPTTDIITGTIKSNIPGRVALRVAQANDSRTILDESGAENLIGKGDMLLARGGKPTVRSQAAWVTNEAIDAICDFIRNQAGPAYDNVLSGTMERIPEEKTTRTVESLLEGLVTTTPKDEPPPYEPGSDEDTSDEGYYLKALEYIRQTGRFSTSVLQRRFKIGYQKAGRITDMLEERGIIGPMRSGGAREILVDLNAEDRMKMAGTDGEAAAFDTRTASAENGDVTAPATDVEPFNAQTDDSAAAPLADDTTEAFDNGIDPAATDDFDLGDFDPSSLELPEIRRPSQS